MKRTLPLLSLTLALVATGAGAASDFVPISSQQAGAIGIQTQTLSGASEGLSGGLPAKVVVPVEQMRVVAAPLAGMLTQVHAVAGQSVKKGQVLARLASPGLIQAQKDYQQARQQADLTRRSLERDELLFQEGIIAESRLQTSRSTQQQAAVAAAALQAELRLAGAGSGASLSPEVAILAPQDGEVLEASASVGSRVEQAAPLFAIGRLNPLWLEIQLPARQAATVAAGQRVSAGAARGKVINVGRQIDPASQTVTLRARLDQGVNALRPGQMVEATVETRIEAGADKGPALFRIPQAALVRQGGATFVFVAETAPSPGFRTLPVSVAGQSGNDLLVSGPSLAPGQRVAIRGVSALKSALAGSGAE